MRVPYFESTMHKQIREKREDRKDRIKQEVDTYGKEILDSDEMKEAFEQTHHLWSTVGEHTIRVTMSSVMICYALRKMKIKANVPAVVIGSLCHDLGILGRYDKFSSGKECSREHPVESVKVAKELVEDLSDESADIIERHMWPAGQSKMPNSLEGLIVSVADKYAAVKDLFKGSDVKQTGVVNTAHQQREKIRETISQRRETPQERKEEGAANIADDIGITDANAAANAAGGSGITDANIAAAVPDGNEVR